MRLENERIQKNQFHTCSALQLSNQRVVRRIKDLHSSKKNRLKATVRGRKKDREVVVKMQRETVKIMHG